MQAQDAFSAGLQKVRSRFLEQLPEQAAMIRDIWAQVQTAPDKPSPILPDIGRIAHRIAGTAATLGFPELGRLAATLEDAVNEAHDRPGGIAALTAPVTAMLQEMTRAAETENQTETETGVQTKTGQA